MSWSGTLSANNYPRGFWARQFDSFETRNQRRFDVIFGVILPVVVLVVDPIVFQNGIRGGPGVLGDYQIFSYLLCGVQMGLLLLWRSCGSRLTSISAVLGGTLIGGAVFSFAIALLLTPFSIIGMLIVIGVAGFTPYLTGFVYLRNGVRAIKAQDKKIPATVRGWVIVGALISSLVTPYVVSTQYSQAVAMCVSDLLYSEGQDVEVAANRLRWFPNIPPKQRRRIIQAYFSEQHLDKKEILAEYWKRLTGEDINEQQYRYRD